MVLLERASNEATRMLIIGFREDVHIGFRYDVQLVVEYHIDIQHCSKYPAKPEVVLLSLNLEILIGVNC